MPSLKWHVLLANPLTAIKVLFLGTHRSLLVLLGRLILPFKARKQSLRNALARAWIRTAHAANSDIYCSAPRRHNCQEVLVGDKERILGGWIVPTTPAAELKHKDAVVLFAHGGGYAIGHGLQNLTALKRWTRKAKAMGQDIAFATVKYRKSWILADRQRVPR